MAYLATPRDPPDNLKPTSDGNKFSTFFCKAFAAPEPVIKTNIAAPNLQVEYVCSRTAPFSSKTLLM